jgi:hypothetical protein
MRRADVHAAVAIAGALAIAASALLAAAGCGKKGAPRPPPRLIPAPIGDLRVRQTEDRLVLEMTYPAVTTGGLPLPAIEALEVLMLRPRAVGGAAPEIQPSTFAAAATVTKRLEGAELAAATRGAELVVELDAVAGPPLGPLAAVAPSAGEPATPAATATPTPPAEPAPAAETEPPGPTPTPDPASGPTPTATPTPERAVTAAGPSPIFFAVRTFGSRRNESPLSNLVAIAPLAAPEPPATLTLTPVADGIRVEWTVAADAPPPAGWDVLRRRFGESSFIDRVARLGSDQLAHVDSTATYGEHYEYTVRATAARDPQIESGDGPVRDLEYLDTFAPPTPTGLVALAEEGRIRLLWDRVEAPDLAGYRLYRQEEGGAQVELPRDPGAGTDHDDGQVRPGVAYTYRVTAVDHEDNESAPSDPATATPR